MTVIDRKMAKSHDEILEEIAKGLDIPDSLYEEAVNRYKSIGAWLDRPQSTLSRYRPAISPQGSILTGTAIRPITDTDEYDVDLVCLLHATKAEFTQAGLKKAVGYEIELYVKSHSMRAAEEGRRCWTVHYEQRARFHMDILPALPDAQQYKLLLEQRGFIELANEKALTGEAIAITDRTVPNYQQVTNDWPLSNPFGYAAWFRNRMAHQLRRRKMVLAEQMMITASVDEIPDHKVKTPLQRAIQLLKRHRDFMFAHDHDLQPISVIITTLAAHAYNEEATIAEALEAILKGMDKFIEKRNGIDWVANPVNPSENFADKWAEEPKKRANFHTWLQQARHDFGLYLKASKFNAMPNNLQKMLGVGLVERVLASVGSATTVGLSAPAIVTGSSVEGDFRRAEAAIRHTQQTGTPSKPWAE